VNLVSFEHYANPAAVVNGLKILTKYASSPVVTFNVQSTSDDTSLSNDLLLASATVVLIWDQPNAPAGTLGTLGTTWAPHLTKFAQGGGIVIALDADQGVGEMPALVTNAGLLAVTGHAQVAPGTPADVPLASLSIARGMTTVYLVETNTAWFTTSEPSGTKTLYHQLSAGGGRPARPSRLSSHSFTRARNRGIPSALRAPYQHKSFPFIRTTAPCAAAGVASARKTSASASLNGCGSSGRRTSSGARALTSAIVTRG
jgi:hypothetical protein